MAIFNFFRDVLFSPVPLATNFMLPLQRVKDTKTVANYKQVLAVTELLMSLSMILEQRYLLVVTGLSS